MKITIACAAAAAFAAAALVSAPAAFATPEDDFLQVIAGGGITWPPEKTPQVIETGQAVCQDWDNGASFEQEVTDLTSVTSWSAGQAATFIGAATGAFCPDYTYKLG